MRDFPPNDPNGVKARKADPDGELIQDPYGLPGELISRTLRKRCPWCGDSFYVFQKWGEELMPDAVDPEPPIIGDLVHGRRSTCGSPDCDDLELSHQTRRSPRYIKAATTSEFLSL